MVGRMHFDAVEPSSRLPFAELFLPFQISYRIRKAFIFNKNENEGNNQKVEKVSGRVRVGVGRALLSQ